MGGTRGSAIVSSEYDVLEMSVVRGVRGLGGVCEMCMCLSRAEWEVRGGECVTGLGLGFTNPVGIGGVWDVCLCLACSSVGGVSSELVGVWARVC